MLLYEHQLKSEAEDKFVEAEMSRQRLINLKKIVNQKAFNEIEQNHLRTAANIEQNLSIELEQHNQQWDAKFVELATSLQKREREMLENQKEELDNFQDRFQKEYPEMPKPSSDLIELNKIKERLKKKKECQNNKLHRVPSSASENSRLVG